MVSINRSDAAYSCIQILLRHQDPEDARVCPVCRELYPRRNEQLLTWLSYKEIHDHSGYDIESVGKACGALRKARLLEDLTRHVVARATSEDRPKGGGQANFWRLIQDPTTEPETAADIFVGLCRRAVRGGVETPKGTLDLLPLLRSDYAKKLAGIALPFFLTLPPDDNRSLAIFATMGFEASRSLEVVAVASVTRTGEMIAMCPCGFDYPLAGEPQRLAPYETAPGSYAPVGVKYRGKCSRCGLEAGFLHLRFPQEISGIMNGIIAAMKKLASDERVELYWLLKEDAGGPFVEIRPIKEVREDQRSGPTDN